MQLSLAELDRFASRYDDPASESFGAVAIATPGGLLSLEGELDEVSADDLLAEPGDELSGWGWNPVKSLKKAATKVYKGARKVTRSPVFRAAAAGACVAFPAAIPAVVALEAANKIATEVEKGTEDAQTLVRNTEAAARKGDKGARRALSHIKLATRARKKAREVAAREAAGGDAPKALPAKPKGTAQPPGPIPGVLVAADGTVIHGVWVKA